MDLFGNHGYNTLVGGSYCELVYSAVYVACFKLSEIVSADVDLGFLTVRVKLQLYTQNRACLKGGIRRCIVAFAVRPDSAAVGGYSENAAVCFVRKI